MSSIAQPVARSVSRSVLAGQRMNLGYLIRSMFSNNEVGFAYDPNDLTTLYQDAAGTIPVTGAGQPVGLMLDKSGRGNHARQTDSACKPKLQRNATTGAYYLEFDGTDDFLVTNSINFTATDKVSLFAGVRKLSDATTQSIVELSDSAGSFGILRGAGSTEYLQSRLRGAYSWQYATTTNNKYAGSVPLAVAVNFDMAGIIKQTLRINGTVATTSLTDVGAMNFGNYPLYIGRRGGTSLPFNGHLYSLIGIGRLTTDSEIIALEKSLAKNVGVTL